MIERWVGLQQVDPSPCRPRLEIGAAEDHPVRSTMHNRTRTHGTGLLGHVQRAAVQAPVFPRILSCREHQHFRVGGRIPEGLHLVPGPRDDPPLLNHHRADGNFFRGVGLLRLPQGLLHEVGITGQVDDGLLAHAAQASTTGEIPKPPNPLRIGPG